MKRRHKRYPKHDSFLFRIRTKKILLRALLITNLELKIILKNGNNNYRKIINNGRVCQVPINRENGASLYKLHARIANLLSSIETPEYLFSSSRGKGYIDNARFHLENCNKRMVKLDIKKFFPSVKFSHIINFFKKSMECSHDVSTILAKLIVFNDFLPTGSPLSDRVSYFAHQDMFDEINKKAGDLGCKMSLWVDDIVISGNKAQEASWEARKIIHNRGLEYHKKDKLKEYLPNNNKEITGVIVTSNGEFKLRNRSHKKIYLLKNQRNKDFQEIAQLRGCIIESRAIFKQNKQDHISLPTPLS